MDLFKRNNIKKTLKENGFSLVEIMVSIGILGIASMAISTGIKTDQMSKKRGNIYSEIDRIMTQISIYMNDKDSCTRTIMPSMLAPPPDMINNTAELNLSGGIRNGATGATVRIDGPPGIPLASSSDPNHKFNYGVRIKKIFIGNVDRQILTRRPLAAGNFEQVVYSELKVTFSFQLNLGIEQTLTRTHVFSSRLINTATMGTQIFASCYSDEDITMDQVQQEKCFEKYYDGSSTAVMMAEFDNSGNCSDDFEENFQDQLAKELCREKFGTSAHYDSISNNCSSSCPSNRYIGVDKNGALLCEP